MRYNQNRAVPPRMIQLKDGSFYRPKLAVRLNRSRKWRPARTYAEARFQSKASHPVR